MDKREAKRQACNRAGSVIESALAGGWEELDRLYGDDRDKVVAALNDLVAELDRRAGREPGDGRPTPAPPPTGIEKDESG